MAWLARPMRVSSDRPRPVYGGGLNLRCGCSLSEPGADRGKTSEEVVQRQPMSARSSIARWCEGMRKSHPSKDGRMRTLPPTPTPTPPTTPPPTPLRLRRLRRRRRTPTPTPPHRTPTPPTPPPLPPLYAAAADDARQASYRRMADGAHPDSRGDIIRFPTREISREDREMPNGDEELNETEDYLLLRLD